MNIRELHSALSLIIARGCDPHAEVVVNLTALNLDCPEWVVVQGVGDPTVPMWNLDDEPADWIWPTLHLELPFGGIKVIEAADSRFTYAHEGRIVPL